MKTKIVAISFINAAPLWWALKDEKSVEIKFAKPSQILSLFKNGNFDIALLPTYEFVKNKFIIAASYGVLSNGNVKSVLLFHKGKIEEVEKIYLDTNSRTSQAMTKYLFQGKSIKFKNKCKDLNDLELNEAQLLIGDKALKLRNCGLKTVDIASLWKKKTGFPALFALWAGKENKSSSKSETLLSESYKKSMKNLDQIVEWAKKKTEIDKRTLKNYFTKSLFYYFGEEGKKALIFYQKVFNEK
jgi:chorismate dehydratase